MPLPSIVESRRRAARLILLDQAGPDPGSDEIAAAAASVFTTLCQRLALLVGSSGASALLARAMGEVAGLTPPPRGRISTPRFPDLVDQLRGALTALPPDSATDSAAALFAEFATILGRLVGDGFATRVFHDLWPQHFPERNPHP